KSSLTSTKDIPMNAQCAVFAESEVVSLIHAKTLKSDIARAVYDGLSSRIQAMALKTGIEKDIVLIGGVANSEGFIESLKRGLKSDIVVAKNPQIVAAIGAAMIAAGK
ncbi:MAG: CoA activase, partial [Chloroflexi bacterium]|nr:CoA activase [Chloroflexota bacterium]